jgi:uncharacterized protein YraI
MSLRTLTFGAAATAMIALPAVAQASWGHVNTTANIRSCPSTACNKIGVLSAGARVWIDGTQGGWYRVSFGDGAGFVAGSLIVAGSGGPSFSDGPYYSDGPYFRGPPPRFGFYRTPWWDTHHHAWYDGRRWYRNGIWYSNPSGLSFGFSFGG